MFDRVQKPFLTVETGEAYQPIRLTYDLYQKERLIRTFSSLKCLERKNAESWNWFWRDECDDLHFESLDSYKKNPTNPIRLGTFSLKNDTLYINLSSFKRACLAVPFFHKVINNEIIKVHKADFVNKVFGVNERLPGAFTEVFDENELEKIVQQRLADYERIQAQIEQASSAEDALKLLSSYTQAESSKRLPYAERYEFQENLNKGVDADVVFLGFYIFLRGRELVAIRRWFGETGYTLAQAAEETVTQVFGDMGIDIID